MRTVLHITTIILLLTGLASCYSEKLLVDDDVYIVQSNKLPVGESLNDQTSYGAFKRQKQTGTAQAAYYQNGQNYLYASSCWGMYSMFSPCSCGFYAMNMYNPYHPSYMGTSMNYGFGNPFFSPYYGMMSPYYNPYFGYGSPYGFGNPYYGNPYGFGNQFGYGYNNPYGYGYGYNYGYGSLINQPVGPQVGGVHYSGPRGSISGYVPNSQRNNPNVLKSNQNVAGGNAGGTPFNRPSQQTASAPSRPSVERPTYTPSVSRGVQQQTTSGGSPVRNTGGVTPVIRSGGGQPDNQQQRVIPQQNQQQQIQRGGGGGGSTPTPSRGTGGGGTGVRRN
jgi:hypothetical protein